MKRICIVGAGAAGLLLLLQLDKHKINPKWVTVIDPTHNGGDLMKRWTNVRSNTTWRQIVEAVPSRNSFAVPWSQFNPEEPVELRYVIEYLRECAKPYMANVLLRTDRVKSVYQENGIWNLVLEHAKHPVVSDVVFFCQGSEPKSLDLPFPSIPLDIALDSRRLSDFVKADQDCLVFGTAHSGPLVVKNLLECGAKVTNFYATEKPFYFARDGEYDGVKQDAEKIADKMLCGEFANLTMESVHDMSAIIRASKTADMCIYACGFEPRIINPEWKLYNGETGRIEGTTTAWGFGIAYPNKAADGVHWDDHDDGKSSGQPPNKPKVYWDVSVPAFQAHIQKQMPDILATLQ